MIMKQNLDKQLSLNQYELVIGNINLQSFIQYLLSLYAPRLTCNAIPRLVYADFTLSEQLLEFKTFVLQYFCNFNSPKNLHLPIGQVKHRIH